VHGPCLFLIYREKRDCALKPHLHLPAPSPKTDAILAHTLPWGGETPPLLGSTAHGIARTMADPTASAAPPKKRSLFKRAAWQDAPKTDSEDMFSHSNEFNDIVAEQARIRAEEKKKAEAARKRKHSEPRDQKRRRISNDSEELAPPQTGSASKEQVSRAASKAYAPSLSPDDCH
jgi:hypothetical protein